LIYCVNRRLQEETERQCGSGVQNTRVHPGLGKNPNTHVYERRWLQDTLKRKLVDFAWNRRFFLFTRRVLAFFGWTRLKVLINPILFFFGAPVLINHRVSLGWTRGNRKGGAQKKTKYRRVFFSRYLAANYGVLHWWNDRHLYRYQYIYLYQYRYIRIGVHPNLHRYIYIYMYIHIYVCMYMYVCMYVYIYISIYLSNHTYQ